MPRHTEVGMSGRFWYSWLGLSAPAVVAITKVLPDHRIKVFRQATPSTAQAEVLDTNALSAKSEIRGERVMFIAPQGKCWFLS